ncbi:serine/threonine protein kinase, partial [Streptomyces sp. Act-28]
HLYQPVTPFTTPIAGAPGKIPRLTERSGTMVIAVAAVLAVVATVLAFTLGDDGDTTARDTGGDRIASVGAIAGTDSADGTGSGGSPDGESGQQQDDGRSGATGGDSGTTGGTNPGTKPSASPGTGTGPALPAGYRTVTDDRFHFSMAMPAGFRMTDVAGRGSGGIFSASGGFPRVQVDYTDSPGGDAAAAWNAAMGAVAASSDGYEHHGIKPVSYNGYPTVADWQFERNQGGTRVWVLNRGFKVDATHGYAIMISCKSGEWNGPECTTLRNTAFATFRPTD